MRFLLVSSVLQVQRLTHYQRLAIYVREGDALRSTFKWGSPPYSMSTAPGAPAAGMAAASEYGVIESMWEPLSPTIPWALACATCPALAPRRGGHADGGG